MKKRVIALLLMSAMVSGLFTGCGNDNSDWIASYKEQKVNVGVYIRYLIEYKSALLN